ncbi:MAG: helix-turn-helix domain-containing protein, partial [Bacteroidota bacterium]
NIRELQHAVERAVILCDCNELTLRDFNFSPCDEKQAAAIVGFDLEHLEKTTIINCITKHRGNISKAAPELGLTRGALYRRLEKYGL